MEDLYRKLKDAVKKLDESQGFANLKDKVNEQKEVTRKVLSRVAELNKDGNEGQLKPQLLDGEPSQPLANDESGAPQKPEEKLTEILGKL